MNSTNSVNNSVSNTDSSSLLPLYTPQSGNLSVMFYIMQAMMAKLDASKQCLDDDKDALLKQEIEQMLQSIDSVDGKEKILAYLKTVMKDADPEIMGWINGIYGQVQNYQHEIDEGILKYQEALDKLNKALEQGEEAEKAANLEYQRYQNALQAAENFKTDWKKPWTYAEKAALYVKAGVIYTAYLACEATAKFLESEAVKRITGANEEKKDLDKEKEALENQIQALLGKSEHSTKDLKALQNAFKQLIQIVQGQLESGWIYKVAHWFSKASETVESGPKATVEGKREWICWPGVPGGYMLGEFLRTGSLFNNSTFLDVISSLSLSTPFGFYPAHEMFHHAYVENVDKQELNFAQVGQTVVGTEQNVLNLVNGLSRLDQQNIAQTIQLNNNAVQDYGNGEKQIQDLAEIFGYVLVNNKI